MTLLLKVRESSIDRSKIKRAARIIRRGGLVVFPTETVYGIGADAYNSSACRRIYEVKGRPSDNPLMIHVCDMDMASRVGVFPRKYIKAVEKVWPGPIAFVVDARKGLGRKEVSVRMPSNKVALALIRESATPIAAPSANISKKPSSTSAAHALMYFNGKVDAIIDSGRSERGIESTILDLRAFVIQRPGAFPAEKIERIFGRKPRISLASRGIKESAVAIAPGMKYRHYSPDTPLFLYTGRIQKLPSVLHGGSGMAFVGSTEACMQLRKMRITAIDLGRRKRMEDIAHNLFDGLIRLDRAGARYAVVEQFSESGLGLGIMNRIRKASNHRSFSTRIQLESLVKSEA